MTTHSLNKNLYIVISVINGDELEFKRVGSWI